MGHRAHVQLLWVVGGGRWVKGLGAGQCLDYRRGEPLMHDVNNVESGHLLIANPWDGRSIQLCVFLDPCMFMSHVLSLSILCADPHTVAGGVSDDEGHGDGLPFRSTTRVKEDKAEYLQVRGIRCTCTHTCSHAQTARHMRPHTLTRTFTQALTGSRA